MFKPRAAENEADTPIPVSHPACLDARNPDFRERPHEIRDAPRARDPVRQGRTLDRIVLTCAADVAATLGDRSLFADPSRARPLTYGWPAKAGRDMTNILSLDDPDHARLRAPLTRVFTAWAAVRPRPHIPQADAIEWLKWVVFRPSSSGCRMHQNGHSRRDRLRPILWKNSGVEAVVVR